LYDTLTRNIGAAAQDRLRKAAARTFDALIQAIAAALKAFTPNECASYLANSGYRRQ
jgi:hypothetical protein